MIVLALDTCFARCAACLFDSAGGGVLAEESLAMERGHAEVLAPMVERILSQAKLKPSDIQRVAVTTGPGTFTGLRIGLSFARAFGLAKGISVVGLDTLQAVALSAEGEHPFIVHKAGQSGYYHCLEVGHGEHITLLSLGEVEDRLAAMPGLVLGTAADEFAVHEGRRRNRDLDLPVLTKLAAYAAAASAPDSMPDPVYIRAPDAKPQIAAPVEIRLAGIPDAEGLSLLHRACFAKGWGADDIVSMLSVPGTQGLIGEAEQNIVCMLIIRTVAGEAEILTLATAPMLRRRGHGAKLLGKLDALARGADIKTIFLEVAESNGAAQALYVHAGFAVSGRRKGYYAQSKGGAEDAILMKKVFAV
jgi:tRNA threonylcarbamoyladenosine biosynthesis protein TsaB